MCVCPSIYPYLPTYLPTYSDWLEIYKHIINLKLDNNSNRNVLNIQKNKLVSLIFINILNFVIMKLYNHNV